MSLKVTGSLSIYRVLTVFELSPVSSACFSWHWKNCEKYEGAGWALARLLQDKARQTVGADARTAQSEHFASNLDWKDFLVRQYVWNFCIILPRLSDSRITYDCWWLRGRLSIMAWRWRGRCGRRDFPTDTVPTAIENHFALLRLNFQFVLSDAISSRDQLLVLSPCKPTSFMVVFINGPVGERKILDVVLISTEVECWIIGTKTLGRTCSFVEIRYLH